MRKNSARKWLHFTLDLLPVIAIPVFMIYSHRHSLTERTNVEVSYKYETNEVNDFDDLVEGNIYHLDQLIPTGHNMLNDDYYVLNIYSYNSFTWDFAPSLYDYEWDTLNDSPSVFLQVSHSNGLDTYLLGYITNGSWLYVELTDINDFIIYDLDFICTDGIDDFVDALEFCQNDYSGEFNFLPSPSTYNVIESVNADTTNENILNVFYKDFTDTIDNYFNFDNVFTFGDIWQWFNTNMFGGNASPIAHAIYEIIVYEFIIDIMFLSYAVFMFIIDFTTDTLERFTGWSSRG